MAHSASKTKRAHPDTRSRSLYAQSGVDTMQADQGLGMLVERISSTWPGPGERGAVQLPIGFFANVVDIDGVGVAISGDSVGTKALIAQMMNKYDTIGIDCVAMNVNDLICVGATPITMIDYLAVEEADPRLIDQIGAGLCEGARIAGISISGGETAQMRDVIKGHQEGKGFDLAGTAIGVVGLDRIIVGEHTQPDDVVIGIESNGIHSNGLSLARRVLFESARLGLDAQSPGLAGTLGEELLRPTHIYVREALDLLNGGIDVKALIHITGDGLLNLARIKAEVGFVIDALPPTPAIFDVIKKHGDVTDAEMFAVFNMGIGFCVVVAPHDVDRALSIIHAAGKRAHRLGHTVASERREVTLTQRGLVGSGKTFQPA